MRILWVKIGGLWPTNTGGRLRTFHMLTELARRHELTLVSTVTSDAEAAALTRALPGCRRVVCVRHQAPKYGSAGFFLALLRSWFGPLPVDLGKNRSPALRQLVRGLLAEGGFDLCIADFLAAFPNIPGTSPVPVVLFEHNVEYQIWRRLAANEGKFLRRLLLQLEWRKMRRYERQACAAAALTITVSEDDGALLARLAPRARILPVPTGVDTDYFMPLPAGKEGEDEGVRLVFSGSMDWFPNEDAMLWFLDAILPVLRRELPAVTLSIVGRNPSDRLRERAAAAGVRVTGTVDDVRPYVGDAAVYVVPLRIGGGTRLKIFEALAMGKAVVSTRIGAEGLPLENDRHVLLADTAGDFARCVLALLRNPEQRRRLGAAGRQLVQTRYSWRRVSAEFETLCRQCLPALGGCRFEAERSPVSLNLEGGNEV